MGVDGDKDIFYSQPIFNIIYYCCQNAFAQKFAEGPTELRAPAPQDLNSATAWVCFFVDRSTPVVVA